MTALVDLSKVPAPSWPGLWVALAIVVSSPPRLDAIALAAPWRGRPDLGGRNFGYQLVESRDLRPYWLDDTQGDKPLRFRSG